MLATAIGSILLALAAANEWQWRTRSRDATIVDATVVDIHADGDGGYFPELEYVLDGKTRRFRSSYSIPPTPFIGTKMPVMVDSIGDSPEIFTSRHRWLLTLIPFAAGAIFVLVGWLAI